MSSLAVKGLAILLATLLVFGLGGIYGGKRATEKLQPVIEKLTLDLAAEKSVSSNLTALSSEQGDAIGRLQRAQEERQKLASDAVGKAKEDSKSDYSAANRIQQERTGGDPAEAASKIIDAELGL
uniref:Inner membrane spanin component n=1 Tax=Pseudomonas phage Orisa03 TaxID=3138542 RepID=A0AAU6W3F8_9VIRU